MGHELPKYTPEAIEKAAKLLAELLHGGGWDTHYTEDQKNVWRIRVKKVMNDL